MWRSLRDLCCRLSPPPTPILLTQSSSSSSLRVLPSLRPYPCRGLFGMANSNPFTPSSSKTLSTAASFSSPSGKSGKGRGRGSGGRRSGVDGASDRIDALGRLLTRILRHMASELNLDIRSDGYVRVRDLLKLNMTTFAKVPLRSQSIDDIRETFALKLVYLVQNLCRRLYVSPRLNQPWDNVLYKALRHHHFKVHGTTSQPGRFIGKVFGKTSNHGNSRQEECLSRSQIELSGRTFALFVGLSSSSHGEV